MIVETLPKLEAYENINHALLYKTYTDKWINQEITEERALLDSDSKRFFAQEVAWEMFKRGQLTVHSSRMSELVEQYLKSKLKKPEDILFLEHDARTASFISRRDELGNYEFMHRSFLEFFVAQKLAEAICQGNRPPFEEQAIYYEIIRFLNQLLDHGRDIPTMLNWWDDPQSNETLRANCIRLSGQWQYEKVLDKLISVVGSRDQLESLRRDAIRSCIRILHGEEADWTERQVKVSLHAYAIRTARDTFSVACLPIIVKLLHPRSATDERSRMLQQYHAKVAKLFLHCLRDDETEEIRINASYALIHFAQANSVTELIEAAESDPSKYVRFNCCTVLITMNLLETIGVVENLVASLPDSQLVLLAKLNLAAIRGETHSTGLPSH